MAFGFEVYDENGIKTLGMEDFTIRKIFEATVPGAQSNWVNGTRTDSVQFTVPGYESDKCFVIITPTTYNTSAQNNSSTPLLTPEFVELGGEVIGIVRYAQDNWFDFSNNIFRQRWRDSSPPCIVEVFKVF